MKIKIFVLEKRTVEGTIEKMGEYSTLEEAELVQKHYRRLFTRIREKQVDSTFRDLEETFAGLCSMIGCVKCSCRCFEKSNQDSWANMDVSQKIETIKKMVQVLTEERRG